MIENITISSTVLIAMIVGLVQVAKWAGLSTRYAGLLAVICGIILGGINYYFNAGLAASLVSGIIMGLIASGAYSGTKALLK